MNNRRTLNEDGSAWVLFKPSGYPFRLRKQLRDATNDEQVLTIMLPYILGIHLPTTDGGEVTKLSSIDDLENIDEAVATQLVMQFYEFRGERNMAPVPKNSSPPSTAT